MVTANMHPYKLQWKKIQSALHPLLFGKIGQAHNIFIMDTLKSNRVNYFYGKW
jgi:hypothetical protein